MRPNSQCVEEFAWTANFFDGESRRDSPTGLLAEFKRMIADAFSMHSANSVELMALQRTGAVMSRYIQS
jgi:hypothetical protein